jgi:hypothetical protein
MANMQPLTPFQLDDPKTTKNMILASALASLGLRIPESSTKPAMINMYKTALLNRTIQGASNTPRNQQRPNPTPCPTTSTTFTVKHAYGTQAVEFHRPFNGDAFRLTSS